MPEQTKAARTEQRRATVERMRAEQARATRRRRTAFVIVAVAGLAIIATIIVVVVTSKPKAVPAVAGRASGEIAPTAVTGATTVEAKLTVIADDSGISGVLAWDTTGWPGDGSVHAGALEHDHVAGPVTYAVVPAVGGPHSAIWMNAGVYTVPVPTERAVHNMEHGGVWITYNPNLPAAQVKQLTAFVTKQSLLPETSQSGVVGQANRYLDLSPWASNALPSPIVISSWGHQLRLSSATDPRLQKFVDTFRMSKKYSPEFGEPVDGIPVLTGGVPATAGSAKANPAGAAE